MSGAGTGSEGGAVYRYRINEFDVTSELPLVAEALALSPRALSPRALSPNPSPFGGRGEPGRFLRLPEEARSSELLRAPSGLTGHNSAIDACPPTGNLPGSPLPSEGEGLGERARGERARPDTARTAPLQVRAASLAAVPSILRKVRRQLAYDVGAGLLIEPRDGLALLVDYRADTVTIDATEANYAAASAWLFNAAFGTRTLLRGGLPVHAAGVEVGGVFVGITAPSGSGKSTLTHYLIRQGVARFGNDDLIPTYADADGGGVTAYPSVSLYPKIGADITARDGLDTATLIRADSSAALEEYYVPLLPAQRVTEASPMCALFLLAPDDGADGVTATRLTPDETALRIRAEMHGLWLIGKYLDGKRIERAAATFAARVPAFVLRYRRDYDALPRLAEIITRTAATL